MPEYFMGLILCPKNKIRLETAHPDLRRTSPQYSTNTLYGQIQPAQALTVQEEQRGCDSDQSIFTLNIYYF